MTSSTTERPRARARRIRTLLANDAVAAALAGLVALACAPVVTSGPSVVDEIDVVNRTPYDVNVQVSDGAGWMNVATAPRDSTATATDVLDQGETWHMRFRSQGHVVLDTQTTRTDLESAGWTIAVPPEVARLLRELGAAESP